MRNFWGTIFCIFVALYSVISCTKAPAPAIDGKYNLNDQSVTVNGIIINMDDYPGCSVRIAHTGNENAEITIDSLLTGIPSITVPCEVSKISGNYNTYGFSGKVSSSIRKIEIKGKMRKANLALYITDLRTSKINGKWMINEEDKLPDISFFFQNPNITTVPINGENIPLETLLAMINAKLPILSEKIFITDYIEFDKTGYINTSYKESHYQYASELIKYEPYMNDVVQYYQNDEESNLHIFLRKTLADALGLPNSPLDFPIKYIESSSDDNKLTFIMDETIIKPRFGVIAKIISNFEYKNYIDAGFPFGDISEDEFEQIKTKIELFLNVLILKDSKYDLTLKFIPYVKGKRVWEN